MKIKICGITNIDDALYISNFNVWALGFIFYKKSPRYIEPIKAKEIIKQLPRNIKKFGVFVNSSIEDILEIKELTGITTIQLHGDENLGFINSLEGNNIIKAFRVKDNDDFEKIKEFNLKRFLIDANVKNEYGGTGHIANWELAKKSKDYGELILAGGINSENIIEAIEKVSPFAIDLSSSVELSAGKKCNTKIKEIFDKVERFL
ncbi:MAG: phosphoribosylanthranilate isomerase [Candidatus Sericytochromatia bacterium]